MNTFEASFLFIAGFAFETGEKGQKCTWTE